MSTTSSSLALLQQNTTRYAFPLLLVFGNFGNLLIIVLFSRKHHRQDPCSLYVLVSAIVNLIGLNWGFGTNLNALYQSPDPFVVSLFLCQFRGYILQAVTAIYRTMIVLASMDRFALSSSRTNIRGFSKRKVALKMIVGTILFWMIATIHLPIFETIQNNRCYVFGTYGLFFSIYQICLFGFIFPCLMIIFSILLWKNLKTIRCRVRPAQEGNDSQRRTLRRRDINLMRFILVQMIVFIFLTCLHPINVLYSVLASAVHNRSQQRIEIEGFIAFITQFVLLYSSYCVPFYLYAIMCKSFRHELKRFLQKCFKHPIQAERNTVPPMNPLRILQLVIHREHVPTNRT